MADVKWIKLVTDVFSNRKIKQIEALPDGDSIIVIWFKLLCLAGSINDAGCVYFTKELPYTDQMLSTQFNRPLHTIQLALKTFEQFGMIEIVEDILKISNWEKYQNVDGMERIKEQNRIRKQRERLRKKELTEPNDVTCHVTVTQNHAIDIDKELDIDKEEDKKNSSKAKRFTKPSLVEIQDYCSERNDNVNPQRFFDYYESNGWKVGKNPMKDWKAAIRTWERNDSSSKAISSSEFNITKFDV